MRSMIVIMIRKAGQHTFLNPHLTHDTVIDHNSFDELMNGVRAFTRSKVNYAVVDVSFLFMGRYKTELTENNYHNLREHQIVTVILERPTGMSTLLESMKKRILLLENYCAYSGA